MAIVFMDSFDHYGNADIFRKWSSGRGEIAPSTGRRGGGCMLNAYCYKNFDASYPAVIAGMAVAFAQLNGLSNLAIMHFGNGLNRYLALQVSPAGEIVVLNDLGATIGRTRPNVMASEAFAYVEVKAISGISNGAVEVRVNGKVELSLTNVRTSELDFVSIGLGELFFNGLRVDDLYVVNTAGTANNDFLGDCRVDAYMPTSEGATLQWTPVPDGVHYTTVDDNPINEADYIETATAGHIDIFGYTDLVNVPLAIYGVQLNTAIRKTDAGEREFNGVARVGGTNYTGPNLSIYDSTLFRPTIWDVNPATSAAWTRAEIDASQFGVKLV